MGLLRERTRPLLGLQAMLHDQGLPFFLWAKACNTVVYIQNKSPHMVLGSVTLEEAFTGKKPQVGHFRIFGCLTYSHVSCKKRTKMEPTTEKRILISYDETSKAYLIFIIVLRRIVVRRDVRFEEDQAFRKSCESNKGEKQAP